MPLIQEYESALDAVFEDACTALEFHLNGEHGKVAGILERIASSARYRDDVRTAEERLGLSDKSL